MAIKSDKYSGRYDVGKGRPPQSTRFKPGQSGNLKGRPKGSKNLTTLLAEALRQKVRIQENGVTRTITARESIALRVVRAAMNGDHKAIVTIFGIEPEIERQAGNGRDTQEAIESMEAFEKIAKALDEITGIADSP